MGNEMAYIIITFYIVITILLLYYILCKKDDNKKTNQTLSLTTEDDCLNIGDKFCSQSFDNKNGKIKKNRLQCCNDNKYGKLTPNNENYECWPEFISKDLLIEYGERIPKNIKCSQELVEYNGKCYLNENDTCPSEMDLCLPNFVCGIPRNGQTVGICKNGLRTSDIFYLRVADFPFYGGQYLSINQNGVISVNMNFASISLICDTNEKIEPNASKNKFIYFNGSVSEPFWLLYNNHTTDIITQKNTQELMAGHIKIEDGIRSSDKLQNPDQYHAKFRFVKIKGSNSDILQYSDVVVLEISSHITGYEYKKVYLRDRQSDNKHLSSYNSGVGEGPISFVITAM